MNTLDDLIAAIDGKLPIVTDSRQIEPGNIFWALRGPNHDGADFAAEAFQRGAVGAVVGKKINVPSDRWAVEADDPLDALWQWAAWRRRNFGGTLIAVTGSVGKTTTRQMIHAVLRSRLKGTARAKSFNNHVGVPLSMSAIEPHHDYAVLELDADRPGEIAALAELCAPKIGVITQIGDVHLCGFVSRDGVAQSKAELLAALPSHGLAILCDAPRLRTVAGQSSAEITWVGTCPGCDLEATDVTSEHGQLRFRVNRQKFRIPVWGRHHLTAALAAVAVGRTMGFDLGEIADVLEDFQVVPTRCEMREIRDATIINDTYNTSPTAMQAALELIRDFDAEGRRIVVVGEMGELGSQAAMMHWQLGKQAVSIGTAELLIACGRFARHVTAGARAAGLPHARAIPCQTVDDALPYLGQAILPGDVVLVKGSRMMDMERLVEALEVYPRRRSA